VVWTRATGEPRRLGTAVQDGQKTLLEFDKDSADLPGLSVVYPSSFAGQRVEWQGDSEEPLHPALMSLVPPLQSDNLQYLIAADRLGLRRETPNKEWRLLTAIGHGSIGHLDVFVSDGEASRWYHRDAPAAPVDLGTSDLVHLATQTLDNRLDPIPLREVLKIVGQAPSPGGAMPKLLHRVVWPATGQQVDALIKFEKAGQGKHQDILVLEDWAYGVHERFGLPVPPRALLRDDHGNQILATARFDRIEGRPVPCESLYNALKILNRRIFETPFTSAYQTEPNFLQVSQALLSPRTGMSADPGADGASMFSRIVLSFLTCNGDLHLKNTSILGARGQARLSPVYDPAPMRLYAAGDDNLTAISFGGLRFFKSKIPQGFGAKLIELGTHFGLRQSRSESVISDALDLTSRAVEEIAAAGAAEKIVLAFDQLQGPVREELEAAVLKNTHAGPRAV
jgi:serine/threonine-protein kinase HipA